MAGRKCGGHSKILGSMFLCSWVFIILSLSQYRVWAETESSVLTLTDANWTIILEGEWMLKFYAPWCPACQHIQADWEVFAKQCQNLGVSVGKVDVTQQPGLSGRFLVTSLPTIFHAKDGTFRRYMLSRNIEDIQAYIVQKKWETVEPLPGWKSPSSILMSGMAGLFRLSVWIRQIHTYLTNTLDIPSWGSYVIFAIITLFLGLLLGLMLVLIADCICPSRHKYKEQNIVVQLKNDGSEDEVDNIFAEEKRLSDLDMNSEGVSGEEESTEEDGGSSTKAEFGRSDQSTEASVRKRRTQGPDDSDGT